MLAGCAAGGRRMLRGRWGLQRLRSRALPVTRSASAHTPCPRQRALLTASTRIPPRRRRPNQHAAAAASPPAQMVVDTTRHETMHVTFNVTFPALPCEMLILDVADVSGTYESEAAMELAK